MEYVRLGVRRVIEEINEKLAALTSALEDQTALIDQLARAAAAGDMAKEPELWAALDRLEAVAPELRERLAGMVQFDWRRHESCAARQ